MNGLDVVEDKANNKLIRDVIIQKLSERLSVEHIKALILYEVARKDGLVNPLIEEELVGRIAAPNEMEAGANKIAQRLVKLYE